MTVNQPPFIFQSFLGPIKNNSALARRTKLTDPLEISLLKISLLLEI